MATKKSIAEQALRIIQGGNISDDVDIDIYYETQEVFSVSSNHGNDNLLSYYNCFSFRRCFWTSLLVSRTNFRGLW